MSVETWGMMPKAQDDDQTIDEAITAAIASHEADSEAHQGEGESLQNHKSEDVIDHPESSIVNDKYENASVSEDKITMTKSYKETLFETIDAWETYYTPGGSVVPFFGTLRMMTNDATDAIANTRAPNGDADFNLGEKNPVFETIVKFSTSATATSLVCAGDIDGDAVGFKCLNGTVYALSIVAGVEYTTNIGAAISQTFERYKVVVTSGVKVEYYRGLNLVHTETTHLPTNTESDYDLDFRLKAGSNSYKYLVIKRTIVYQDL